MAELIFNEESFLTNNLFKFESRLKNKNLRFVEGNATLTTYFNIADDLTTTDRGLQDIEQLFGKDAPIRYNEIRNMPLYGFAQASVANSDEQQVEDISVEGECLILPATIVPHPHDFFIVNHLRMKNLFQILDVTYDSMKSEGHYKIRYKLYSTSAESIQDIRRRVVEKYHCQMGAIGTDKDPIIKVDDFIRRGQIIKMVNEMIKSYRALFYNKRHNCFLYHDIETNTRWFDLSGNDFMAKHSIMNYENCPTSIMLHHKLNEEQAAYYYNTSVYAWLERDAPLRFLDAFRFRFVEGISYIDSSFYKWYDEDVMIAVPAPRECRASMCHRLFNDKQLQLFSDPCLTGHEEYDILIHKFIQGQLSSVGDISLYTADALMNSLSHKEIFFYTPIIIYIIRKVLSFN